MHYHEAAIKEAKNRRRHALWKKIYQVRVHRWNRVFHLTFPQYGACDRWLMMFEIIKGSKTVQEEAKRLELDIIKMLEFNH